MCCGYSLLAHEEIVDIVWKDQLEPLLLKRYPAATPDQLRGAHAYAYGGCLIQDIGYYPFGNKFFSEVTHYVRTGEFVANLIRESQDLDEYAFALGALGHYSSDNMAHPLINHAAALSFPKLRQKYGDEVTYEESPRAHIRTEFGFDITQVAKHRYASDRYHDFIGFQVSRPVLDRAFLKTYGVPLEQVLGQEDMAIGTFRHAVSQVIPEMTRAALSVYHPEIVRETPNFNKNRFLYNLSRAQYEAEWGREYRKPGLIARFLGCLVQWAPKISLLSALAFKIPTPETEDLYLQSVNLTLENYRALLRQVAEGNLQFPDTDCDTGRPTFPGEYRLADKTYARLLDTLVKRGLAGVQPDLRDHMLTFYRERKGPRTTSLKAWHRTQLQLQALRAGPNTELAEDIRKRLLGPPFKLESPKAKGQ